MGQIDLTAVAGLLEQQSRIREFRKNTYADSFESFMEENKEVWSSFRQLFAQEEEPVQTEEDVAECLVRQAQEMIAEEKKRVDKEERLLNINLFMVSYMFPAILACQEYPQKEGNAAKMADAICRKWKEAFPKYTISYADYASIQGGFKQKLCYITTAVCLGVHKQQDCREIMLMKQYRDEYLLKQEDGEEIVKKYYDIAPTIVKRIAKEDTPEEKYQYLWEHYLKFCVTLIESRQYEACRETYERMVEELKREYIITNDREDHNE